MSDAHEGYKTLQHLVHRPVHTPAPVFKRWPEMLTHPEHVDAVPDRHETTLITPPGGLQVPYTRNSSIRQDRRRNIRRSL